MAVNPEAADQATVLTGADRFACILYSVATAPRGAVTPLGAIGDDGIENRYLEDGRGLPGGNLSAVDELVAHTQATMLETRRWFGPVLDAALSGSDVEGDPAFSGDRIVGYTAREQAARRSFGQRVIDLAQSAGLARTVPTDIVHALTSRDLVAEATKGRGVFRRADGGWGILDTVDGPALFKLNPVPDGETPPSREFTAVLLDGLHDTHGSELRSIIESVHRAQARGQLVRFVGRSLALHESDWPTRVPESIQRLATMEDREQAAADLVSITNYLRTLRTGGNNRLQQQAWRYVHTMVDPVDFDASGTNFASMQLEHLAHCPAEPADSRQMAARQLEVITAFNSTDTGSETQKPTQTMTDLTPIILDPIRATIRDREGLGQWRAGLFEKNQALHCLEELAEIADPGMLLETLERHWPEQHRTITAFRAWMNTGSMTGSETDRLDEAVRSAAAELDRHLDLHNDMSVDTLWGVISKQISRRMPHTTAEPFPGVIPVRDEDPALMSNPDLVAVLPILVLATAAHEHTGDKVRPDPYQQLQLRWLDRCNNNLIRHERTIAEIEARLATLDQFMATYGLTQEDIDHTAAIAARPAEFAGVPQRGKTVVSKIYDPLLVALALHRQGRLDLASPAVQDFFRDFLEKPDLDLSQLAL